MPPGPHILEIPQRLLVVAAHPDDDVIGCGGLMAQVARSGGTVRVIYVSDGSRSHTGSVRFSANDIARMRAMEARAALRGLGVAQEPLFCALEDGTLSELAPAKRAAAVDRISRLIAHVGPDLVLAPWRRDPHPDHMAAARICHDAIDLAGRDNTHGGYEVWLPIRGDAEAQPLETEATTYIIELDDATRILKRDAIRAHRTQTTGLIDDDPDGFRIGEDLIDRWTSSRERYYLYR